MDINTWENHNPAQSTSTVRYRHTKSANKEANLDFVKTYQDYYRRMCDAKVSSMRPDTSSSYLRKIKKPLIERKRRERINNCLLQLKDLLLDNIKHNGGTQVSKLDKADILEMTVSHLRQIQHQQLSVAMATSASVVQQYREGFSECANETVRYMDASQGYPSDMVSRVSGHLTTKIAYVHGIDHYRNIPNDIHFSSTSPIQIKVESPTSCRSIPHTAYSPVSPGCDVRVNYSPLLVPVTQVKSASSGHTSDGQSLNSSACSTDTNNTSTSSVLSSPSHASNNVNVPSPQKVWRPF